jgi:hypothetical protein
VLFRVNDVRLKALLEHMPSTAVACVEPLCVKTVQPMHSERERFPARFENEVIVRRHQAVGVTHPQEPTRGSDEVLDEVTTVDIVTEESVAAYRPRSYVKEAVTELTSRASRHARLLSRSFDPI